MPFVVTFIVLCIAGILDAGYLTYKHETKKKKPLVCPLNHDCSAVTESKWSAIFGVRNEVLGLLYYIFSLAVIIVAVTLSANGRFLLLLFLSSAAGLLFSFFLTTIQIYKIKDYCFYCIISAIITLLMFLNSAALFSFK